MKYTKNNLLNLLRNAICEVTFTKVSDGSTRYMECTLKEDVLDDYDVEFKNVGKKPNPDVIPVFDLDLEEWRSFRLDSIKKIVIRGTQSQ